MPLTAIVTIVLRIYSLIWLVDGIVKCISGIVEKPPFYGFHHSPFMLEGIIFVLMALVVFAFSHPIARIVVPPPNSEVNLGTLTRYDLYSFAFTFLGLYFFLSSIGAAVNTLHNYLLTTQTTHEGAGERLEAFYRLTRPVLTAIAGIAALLLAPKLAQKLTATQQQPAPPQPIDAKKSA